MRATVADWNRFHTLWHLTRGENYPSLLTVDRRDVELLEKTLVEWERRGEELLYEAGVVFDVRRGSRRSRWRDRTALIVENPRTVIFNFYDWYEPALYRIQHALSRLLGVEVAFVKAGYEALLVVPSRLAILLSLPLFASGGRSVKFEKGDNRGRA